MITEGNTNVHKRDDQEGNTNIHKRASTKSNQYLCFDMMIDSKLKILLSGKLLHFIFKIKNDGFVVRILSLYMYQPTIIAKYIIRKGK